MNNVALGLTKKKDHFVELRRRAKEDADQRIQEYDAEIEKIDQEISTINDAMKGYLCPVCGDSGTCRKADAAGQMEDVLCIVCGGMGVKICKCLNEEEPRVRGEERQPI